MPNRGTTVVPIRPQHRNGHEIPKQPSATLVRTSTRTPTSPPTLKAPAEPWMSAAQRFIAGVPASRRLELNGTEKVAALQYLLWSIVGENFGKTQNKLPFLGIAPEIDITTSGEVRTQMARHLYGLGFTPKFKVEGKTIMGHATNGVWVNLAFLGDAALLTIAEQCFEQDKLDPADRAHGVFCTQKKRDKRSSRVTTSPWNSIMSSLRARNGNGNGNGTH